MRPPWEREKRSSLIAGQVSTKAQELEAAKEILSEVFHVQPVDVEDMIQRRLEERSSPDRHEVGLWPATFYLGE